MWEKKSKQTQNSDTTDLLEEINEFIRLGQGSVAKTKLLSINTKKLKSAFERVRYSNLARRLSLTQVALKLLHPIVRPKSKVYIKATEEECIEYAASLIKIGAHTEALSILKTLNTGSQPQVFLFMAFAHIATWDYDMAIPLLQKYIDSNGISQYEKLVAKANLCEAMGYIKHPDTDNIISNTLMEAKVQNYNIIFAHVQMTRSIRAIEYKQWDKALEALEIAESIFSVSDTINSFFIRKWRAILGFYKDDKHSRSELDSIRKEAKEKWNHWETVRDCDFYEAIITRNEQLFNRLYFGTPFTSFRNRLIKHWDKHGPVPKLFSWELNTRSAPKKILELFSGNNEERIKLLQARKQVASTLGVLSSDFYRPMRTAFLFSRLFPNEYFNPNSSPIKLRLAIHRTRKWLKTENLPLQLLENNGAYRLDSIVPLKMIIPNNLADSHSETVVHKTELLNSLLVQKDSFSTQEVCAVLNLPRRSANRLLNSAIEKGLIVRTGCGKQTGYAWAEKEQKLLKAG